MKKVYRGCNLNVDRENDITYFSAYTKDGYCIAESYTEGRDSIRSIIEELKNLVDEFFTLR